jgi:hypothetical protein
MTDHRRARAEMLARELNIESAELPKVLDRYAKGYLQTFPTFADACLELGDGVLEGYLPAGVYDLDTGELIELHVTTPVVSRSEDQGVTRNPLQAALRCFAGHTWYAAIIEDKEGAVIVADDHSAACPECGVPGEAV